MDRLADKAHNLAHLPGVYLMKNKQNEIIYVGKAKNLKNRVSSYFQLNNPSHNEKVKKMVSHVFDFDYIVVDSEFEALVLECSLIKLHSPKYNILLKDDKGYHYIKITKEDFPRFSAVHSGDDLNADMLGPYVSSFSVTQTVDEVNRIFRFPTCSKKFPQDIRKSRPCLNYHINRCMGVCRGKITKDEYGALVAEAVSYIKKDGGNIVERLTEQMNAAAEALDFEKAARLRDRIQAISKITDSQKVVMIGEDNQDVIAFARVGTIAQASILRFRSARLIDKRDYSLYDVYDVNQARQELLEQYYVEEGDIPKRILIDEDFDGRELLEQYLTQKENRRIYILVPQKGESRKIVEMAYKNASEQLSKLVSRTGYEVSALDDLTKLLGLEKTPEYIEAYDISNMGESNMVGGMVVFSKGRPLKKAYRKFKIKDVAGQDDYSSMREVVRRRFENYFEEKDSGEGFGRLPDLILLDGGKGHVAAVEPMLREMGISVPVFGMVKDSKHRTRAIAENGGEIAISGSKSAFNFVTNIQDEVHRYAINYQKAVHKKTGLEITLTRVKGIGEKKATAILKKFKTKEALKNATVEEIMKTAGVKRDVAEELCNFIRECY